MAYDGAVAYRTLGQYDRVRSVSLEEDAFDQLRNNRSDLDLHIPLLSGNPWVHGHVLHCELNFDGQTP